MNSMQVRDHGDPCRFSPAPFPCVFPLSLPFFCSKFPLPTLGPVLEQQTSPSRL
jgi:hypothetical protein